MLLLECFVIYFQVAFQDIIQDKQVCSFSLSRVHNILFYMDAFGCKYLLGVLDHHYPIWVCLFSLWHKRIKLSSNSTRVLVGSWLFCIQFFSMFNKFSYYVWSWCGGKNKKHYVSDLSGGQIHCSTSWHAKTTLTLNEPIYRKLLVQNNQILCKNLILN